MMLSIADDALRFVAAEDGGSGAGLQIIIGVLGTIVASVVAVVVPGMFKRRSERQEDRHWSYDQLQENRDALQKQNEAFVGETKALRQEVRDVTDRYDKKIGELEARHTDERSRDELRRHQEIEAVWAYARSVMGENQELRQQWPPPPAKRPPRPWVHPLPPTTGPVAV